MEHIFCCPKCGSTYGLDSPDATKACSDCNVETVYTGYTDEEWSKLSLKEKMAIKKNPNSPSIREQKQEKESHVKAVSEITLSTCPSIEGYSVIEQFGLVFGECIYKVGFVKSISNAFNNLGDMLSFDDKELSGSASALKDAREYAIRKMCEDAVNRGANAVIGIDSESSFGGDIMHITIYGTAVKIQKLN